MFFLFKDHKIGLTGSRWEGADEQFDSRSTQIRLIVFIVAKSSLYFQSVVSNSVICRKIFLMMPFNFGLQELITMTCVLYNFWRWNRHITVTSGAEYAYQRGPKYTSQCLGATNEIGIFSEAASTNVHSFVNIWPRKPDIFTNKYGYTLTISRKLHFGQLITYLNKCS